MKGNNFFLSVMCSGVVFLILALCSAGVSSGAEVGIYNPVPAGGRAMGITAIRTTLAEAGIETDEFSRLSLENLLNYRAVIIPNTPGLARGEDPRFIDNLRAYVVEAGGAVIFNHDAIGAERSPFGRVPLFPEIAMPGSIERVARVEDGERLPIEVEVAVRDVLHVGYDYLPEYEFGQRALQMYFDRFVFEQAEGEPLLVCTETRKTVAGVGEVGAGRVVLNGMFGGDPLTGEAARLEGIDREVMVNAVRWALDGAGLAVTDASKIEVAEWTRRMTDVPEAGSRVAVIASQELRFSWGRNAMEIGIPEPDFIPLHFLSMRDLSPEDYGLVFLFAPASHQERNVPEEAFQRIEEYIAAGGRAVVFMPGPIGRGIESMFLQPLGSGRIGIVRDNIDYIHSVIWTDDEGRQVELNDGIGGDQWFTHIREPESEDAETVGYTINVHGERVSPAIIRTPYGYITNMHLHGDHRLFTTNAAVELLPELGQEVFRHLVETFEDIKEQTGDIRFSREGRAKANQAERMRRQAEREASRRNYSEACRLILRAEREMIEAYAVSMPSVPDERRMVFTHGRGDIDPEIYCSRLAAAGFNGLVVTHLEGRYPSGIIPRTDGADDTDWMKKWIDAAHKHGLEIGPALMTFTIYRGSATYDRAVSEDWRVVTAEMYGREREPAGTPWRLDPCRSRPEVVDYAVARATEIIENYPIQHVNFDYIRWSATCYCDYCREKFQEDTGIRIEEWPGDAMTKYSGEYNDWRAKPVTAIIRRTSEKIARINPDIKLSFCGFGGLRGGRARAQYWWEWVDFVDFHMPMRYSPALGELEEEFGGYNELKPEGSRMKLLPLLAPTAHGRGGPPLLRLKQLNIQREHAPAGVMYFAYRLLTDSYLDLLRMGPWRETETLLDAKR